MPEGGKVTPISPGIVQRVTQAARYVISGVGPETWFGPMQPLPPMAPAEVVGRKYDYPDGYNLNYRPRSYEGTSFEDLRALADNCDILRSVIETRKDQMEALDWNIRIKPDDQDKRITATGEQQKRIDAITAFFQSPDKRNSWQQWLRQWLEDMFVIDAACFYKRPDRKGNLWGLEPVDGAGIKILIGNDGRIPLPPEPAYQQILHGIPAVDYAQYGGDENGIVKYGSNELLYLMRNPRTHKTTGYSHVEQVLLTVNIAIRRTLYQLEYYREGSQPDAFLGLPKEWTTEQIVGFQNHFDSMMSGNLGRRRRLKFMPGDFKYQATKDPVLKDEYDEWLARIICFVFSIAPTPFIKAARSGEAQKTSHDAALEEGLAPLQKYVKNNLNRIIATDFDSPDIEFDWVDDREQDPLQAAQIREGDVKAGIISIDESRESMGLVPLGGAYAVPMPLTPTGYVAIKSPEEQDAADQAQQQATQAMAEARLRAGQNSKDDDHGGGDGAKNKPKDDSADAGKVIKGLKKKAQSLSPHDRPQAHKSRAAIEKLAEKVLTKTGKSVRKQLETALGKLAKDNSGDEADGIVTDLDLGILAGFSVVHPWLEDVATDRAGDELLSLGISEETDFFSHANERAAAYAKKRAADLVTDIDDSTRSMLRDIITDGLEAGAMREDIIADIMASDIFSEDRATLIADTEIAMAIGAGAQEGRREAIKAGVKLKKYWVTDDDPCEDCEENADAQEIDNESEFPSGDMDVPAHPRCHCHVESAVEDDDHDEDDE